MNIICAIKQQEKLKMKMQFPLFRHTFVTYTGLWLMVSLFVVGLPARAETITIGKGSGIVWEGMPFNVTVSGPVRINWTNVNAPLLTISNSQTSCMKKSSLKVIGGYNAYQIAPGVGLIPRAIGTATFRAYATPDIDTTYSATLGLPASRGIGENWHLTPDKDYDWCVPHIMSNLTEGFARNTPRTAKFSGSWVIVTNGTRRATEVILEPMYAVSMPSAVYDTILPTNTTLRITNLECTVNTPTQINFGPVAHDPTTGAELGSLSYPLTTQCSQDSDRVNANINLQFRAISGLYQNSPTQLSLTAGGGYITGEIDNGVTGSGSCTVASGIPFDNKAIRIGRITSTQSSQTLTNQVTWRLCSGGPSLPLGNVDAAAEMQVTFN